MTISDETIKKAVARYQREYDRYLKLAARVADICRTEVVEGNAIRAQVTSRAKSPKSLEGKLRRFAASGKKAMDDDDAVFAQIRDLSAVRIATYEQRHEDQVVSLVTRRFVSDQGDPPAPERKDKNRDNPDNFYRATHLEVFLKPSDIVGTYANVADVPCEIQVCSMMAHVWNEIEHDLGYKPFSGSLSTFERDQLKHLGMMVRTADGIISQLLAETDRRLAAETTPFADVYDFVARLRPWFPGVDFGKHAGPLFEVLRPLRLLTPEAIRRQIDLPDPIAPAAKARGEMVMDFEIDLRDLLDLDSSDLLLLALVPKLGKVLVRNQPGDQPAITRIRNIAFLTAMHLQGSAPVAGSGS